MLNKSQHKELMNLFKKLGIMACVAIMEGESFVMCPNERHRMDLIRALKIEEKYLEIDIHERAKQHYEHDKEVREGKKDKKEPLEYIG